MQRTTQTLIALTLALTFAGNLNAAPTANTSRIYRPSPKYKLTKEERAQEDIRLKQISQRSQYLFALSSAEMALTKGDVKSALGLYIYTLNQTKSSDVAERAMDIAIETHNYPIAEAIYQEWRKIEPNPSATQKRLAWVRALALGDTATIVGTLKETLASADEAQRSRAFLLLAQAALSKNDLLVQGKTVVHEAAQQYPDLPEAAVADIFFNSGDEAIVIAALQRLAKHDAEISPPTQLTLQVIVQNHPKVLTKFFEKTDLSTLSPVWQQLEIESLIHNGDYRKAQRKLDKLIAKDPKAELYFQAAKLANKRNPKNISDTVLNYTRAYQIGTSEQKYQAALSLALLYASNKEYDQAIQWAQKIDSSDNITDRETLLASLASEQKNWTVALQHAKAALDSQNSSKNPVFTRQEISALYAYILTQSLPPEQALAQINQQLAQIDKQKSSPTYAIERSSLIYQRGLLYADKLRQPEKAIADFRTYLTHNPDSAQGQNALGYNLLEMGKEHLPEALALISAAYKKEPNNPQIADSMGWAYYQNAEYQKAQTILAQAYEQDKDAEIGAHLGAALWQLGKHRQAKKIWQASWQKEAGNPALQKILKEFNISFEQ
ncbi:tetratricopeptide repeat protein [Kingella oralis]|uniref:tetratricopeptide repeat protein n=1 Tax=Kingella oralis TaxID=505 RepID=UPI0034E43EC1